MEEGGSVVSTLLRIVGGRSFHIEGPILANTRCWASAVLVRELADQGDQQT